MPCIQGDSARIAQRRRLNTHAAGTSEKAQWEPARITTNLDRNYKNKPHKAHKCLKEKILTKTRI